jgi:hypothetical protein
MLIAHVFQVRRGEWVWRTRNRKGEPETMSARTFKTRGRCVNHVQHHEPSAGLLVRVHKHIGPDADAPGTRDEPPAMTRTKRVMARTPTSKPTTTRQPH